MNVLRSQRAEAGPKDLAPWSAVFMATLWPFLLAALIGGCASRPAGPLYGWNWSGPVPDGYYLVRAGDSLGGVAARVGVSQRQLARWNRLDPPYTIYADTLLRIAPPDGSSPMRPASPLVPPAALGGAAETVRQPAPAQPVVDQPRAPARRADAAPGMVERDGSAGLVWQWPLSGELVQTFREGDLLRQGIRVAGHAGAPVRAAADGRIVYSGSGLKRYGNLIIVKHSDEYLSAYGFNRRLLVGEGERVKRGQVVAEMGQGPGGAYLLHFEVRRDGVAVDPMRYLPTRN